MSFLVAGCAALAFVARARVSHGGGTPHFGKTQCRRQAEVCSAWNIVCSFARDDGPPACECAPKHLEHRRAAIRISSWRRRRVGNAVCRIRGGAGEGARYWHRTAGDRGHGHAPKPRTCRTRRSRSPRSPRKTREDAQHHQHRVISLADGTQRAVPSRCRALSALASPPSSAASGSGDTSPRLAKPRGGVLHR